MKVLLLTDDLFIGGVPRYVTDLANGMQTRGVDVMVAASDGPFRSRLRQDIPFVPIRLLKRDGGFKSPSGFFSAANLLTSIIRREGVNLVHSQKRYTDVLGRYLARRCGIPHVSTCHSLHNNLRRLSLFGDTTIACSDAIARQLHGYFGRPDGCVTTIYAGIDPIVRYGEHEKTEARERLRVPGGTRVIGCIGRLSRIKGHSILIDAIAALKDEVARASSMLIIQGNGAEEPRLRSQIDALDVANLVKLVPASENTGDLINVAEFLILPSLDEGMGYVLLDAASGGKMHIASDVGGVPEFITHGVNGILVPPGDASSLANAIQHLLLNPAEAGRLGLAAEKSFQNWQSPKTFVEAVKRVYERAIAHQFVGRSTIASRGS